MRFGGPLRLYSYEDDVCVAVDDDKLRSYHLESMDGRLIWVRRPEGMIMERIPLADFIAWLDQGGLKSDR